MVRAGEAPGTRQPPSRCGGAARTHLGGGELGGSAAGAHAPRGQQLREAGVAAVGRARAATRGQSHIRAPSRPDGAAPQITGKAGFYAKREEPFRASSGETGSDCSPQVPLNLPR